jgi:hypothetical protein
VTALDEAYSMVEPTPHGAEVRESFKVTGLETLDWALRKLAEIEAERAGIRDFVLERIGRLEKFAADQDGPLAREADYFRGLAVAYALQQRAADPRCKSVAAPHGTVSTRESGGSWSASDEAVAWALFAHPELVETTSRLKVADAKRLPGVRVDAGQVVDATGEIIPGIVVSPKVVTATVKLVVDEAEEISRG